MCFVRCRRESRRLNLQISAVLLDEEITYAVVEQFADTAELCQSLAPSSHYSSLVIPSFEPGTTSAIHSAAIYIRRSYILTDNTEWQT